MSSSPSGNGHSEIFLASQSSMAYVSLVVLFLIFRTKLIPSDQSVGSDLTRPKSLHLICPKMTSSQMRSAAWFVPL